MVHKHYVCVCTTRDTGGGDDDDDDDGRREKRPLLYEGGA